MNKFHEATSTEIQGRRFFRSETQQHTPLKKLLTGMLPATTSMYALYQAIQQVLIPLQVQQIDPENKVANLAILTAIVAVSSMIALPLGGALSDQTRSRFGKRNPWLILMSIISFGLASIMGFVNNIPLLIFLMSLLWLASNIYQGVWSAILPERVPENKRGVASSVISFGVPIGILFGVNFVSHVPMYLGYIVIGALFFLCTLLLVTLAPEKSNKHEVLPVKERNTLNKSAVLFFKSFSSRNFTLAFTSRFFLYLSYFIVNGYLLYVLQDWIGVENLPGKSPAIAIGYLVTLNTCSWILFTALSGWIADKLQKRKIFVGVSALGISASVFIPIFYPTWEGMLVYSVLMGGFKGVYLAVDMALMSLVLPDASSKGRDMGLLSIATGSPQIISGLIAGVLITLSGSYLSLFYFSAFTALLSGLSVFLIRGIK